MDVPVSTEEERIVDFKNELDTEDLAWIYSHKIQITKLIVKSGVPSTLAIAVAKISPDLVTLYLNYDKDNLTLLEGLEEFCPKLESVTLLCTRLSWHWGGYFRQDFVVTLDETIDEDTLLWNGAKPVALFGINKRRATLFTRPFISFDLWLFNGVLLRSLLDGYKETAKFVIKHRGASVNAQTWNNGATALSLASGSGYVDIVKLILSIDRASIDLQDWEKSSAILDSLNEGHYHVTEYLIKAGANLELVGENNCSFLELLKSMVDGTSNFHYCKPTADQLKQLKHLWDVAQTHRRVIAVERPICKMPAQFFNILIPFLDWNDVAHLDIAISCVSGRVTFLETLCSGAVTFKGSKSQTDYLSRPCLEWLLKHSLGVEFLSNRDSRDKDEVFAVARNSPTLRCLHVASREFFEDELRNLEPFCPMLEEIGLRGAAVYFYMNEFGPIIVELDKCDSKDDEDEGEDGANCILFERPRLAANDWHRSSDTLWLPQIERKYSWKRFLFTKGLLVALLDNKPTIAEQVIDSGFANVNVQTVTGTTALFLAASKGFSNTVQKILLKDSRFSIDIQQPPSKETPLMAACCAGHIEVINLLLTLAHPNIGIQNAGGLTAIDFINRAILNEDGRFNEEEINKLISLHAKMSQ